MPILDGLETAAAIKEKFRQVNAKLSKKLKSNFIETSERLLILRPLICYMT